MNEGRFSSEYEFVVIRAGDDPMVVMKEESTQDYGDHGGWRKFEVTLTEQKMIAQDGW